MMVQNMKPFGQGFISMSAPTKRNRKDVFIIRDYTRWQSSNGVDDGQM
jgi:hypothetical protein